MAIKYIHFVRHGETVANQHSRHQGPEEGLSEIGRKQARVVAEKLAEVPVDGLLASSYTRARETAEPIALATGCPYTLTDTVVEFKRPNYLYGRSHYSPVSFFYVLRLYINQVNPDWDDDGAENLFHVHQRMKNAKRQIEETHGERIVVVSHALFMDMFREMVCADRDLTISEFVRGLVLAKKVPNTGVLTFAVDTNAPGQTCKWWYCGNSVEATLQLGSA